MIVLVVLLLLGPPRAEDRAEAERLFTLGLDLLAEGDTTGALAAWDGAGATEWTSAALSYNRGVVARSRGDLGTARLAFERAARLAPRDQTIATALADVRERSGVEPPSLVEAAVRRAGASLGRGGAVALALGLYLLTLTLAALWWRRRSRPFALGAATVGVAGALALVVAVGVLHEARPRGIVLADGAVRTAPSPTASEAAALRAGEAVDLGHTDGAWQAVTVGDIEGWIPRASVEAL